MLWISAVISSRASKIARVQTTALQKLVADVKIGLSRQARQVALTESRVSGISNKNASHLRAAALNNTDFTQLHRRPPRLTSLHNTQCIPAHLWFWRRIRGIGRQCIVVARVLLQQRRRRRVGRHLS